MVRIEGMGALVGGGDDRGEDVSDDRLCRFRTTSERIDRDNSSCAQEGMDASLSRGTSGMPSVTNDHPYSISRVWILRARSTSCPSRVCASTGATSSPRMQSHGSVLQFDIRLRWTVARNIKSATWRQLLRDRLRTVVSVLPDLLFSLDLAFLSRLGLVGWESVAMAWERRLRRRICAEHGEAVPLQDENGADGKECESTLSVVPSNIVTSIMLATSSADNVEGKGMTLRTSGRSVGDGKSACDCEELAHVAERERVGGALQGREESGKRRL